MKDTIRVGLMGLIFNSINLGCGALSYGFLRVLEKIADEKGILMTIVSFEDCDEEYVRSYIKSQRIVFKRAYVGSIRNVKNLALLVKELNCCDVVFDFTSGDSFTDIYGKSRYYSRSFRKELVLFSKSELVLGSQTIGPFGDKRIIKNAGSIIRRSKAVITRDSLSSQYILHEYGIKPLQTIDVAFMLPYNESIIGTDRLDVGFNPSGLLWNGMNTNGFDYRYFCEKTIEAIISKTNYNLILIPHVGSDDMTILDNDYSPCFELSKKYGLKIAPKFSNPIEAKTYISGLQLFIGSRMHATIAALSAGVPTIPVAYSRKFEGVFSDLNYNYIINMKDNDADVAKERVIDWICNIDEMRTQTNNATRKVELLLDQLIETYTSILIPETAE